MKNHFELFGLAPAYALDLVHLDRAYRDIQANIRQPQMKWTDSRDIAITLLEQLPDHDPKAINFVDLRNWVLALPGFDDDPKRSGEKILEAIQMAWIDEAE